MAKKSVEEQKGKLEVREPTYRTQTRMQKVDERLQQYKDLRSAQTLTLHEPKQ